MDVSLDVGSLKGLSCHSRADSSDMSGLRESTDADSKQDVVPKLQTQFCPIDWS